MNTYAYMPGNDEKLKAAFMKLGIAEENIFADMIKNGNGTAYKKLLQRLEKGDTLYVQNFDAFGMNMREICSQWRSLTKDKGVDIVVMTSPLLDTRIGKELNGSLVGDIVTEILTYAANDEHDRWHMRQKDGIERAKKKGVHCGRAKRPLPENFPEICEEWKIGEITGVEAAQRCNMPISTFRYHAKKYNKSR